MGYRSDVMAVIYPDVPYNNKAEELEKYNQLKTLMGTTFKTLMDDYFGEDAEWVDDRRVLKFNIENVKWYDSYPDVRAFKDMLRELNGTVAVPIGGYCTEFMRIGEDDNDIEVDNDGDNVHYYLSVHRQIVCDV